MGNQAEQESLSTQADHALEEARMMLPGAETLFGFQLIAVFNQRFQTLTELQQHLHLAALFAVAVAVALILTPALYHRQTQPDKISRGFLVLATRCLTASSYPLLIGIALEFYIVSTLVTPYAAVSFALTAVVVGHLRDAVVRASLVGKAHAALIGRSAYTLLRFAADLRLHPGRGTCANQFRRGTHAHGRDRRRTQHAERLC